MLKIECAHNIPYKNDWLNLDLTEASIDMNRRMAGMIVSTCETFEGVCPTDCLMRRYSRSDTDTIRSAVEKQDLSILGGNENK